MQRLSTNATLFFKLFVPVFWMSFFGALTLAILIKGGALAPVFADPLFRVGAVVFYLSGLVVFYFLLFPLKRVECDADFLYVTNYFKTFRYPWDSIAHFSESTFLFFTIVTIHLPQAGHFGANMRFIASQKHYRDFKATAPSSLIFQ
ncbi:MAG: hypothetical protein R2795_00575 [Saprospiraceae bacterium]